MFNKFDMMLLMSNESINDRFYDNEKTNLRRIFQIKNQFKSIKNSVFEILFNRILN